MPGSDLLPESGLGARVRAGQAHGPKDVGSAADRGPAGLGTPMGAGLPDPSESLGPFPWPGALQGWGGGEARLLPC